MTQQVYSITIPYPVSVSRKRDEWTTNHHQLLFNRMPTKRELLFFLHEKGDEAYQRSGNDSNIWWELIEVLSYIPPMRWFGVDGFESLHLQSSNIVLDHPILGTLSVTFEKMAIEPLDEEDPQASIDHYCATASEHESRVDELMHASFGHNKAAN